jgi:YVTN family beta-propeller protein
MRCDEVFPGRVSTPFPCGRNTYVVNSGSDNISIIDIASRTVVATVSVGAGPFAAAVSHDKALLYVTNTGSNNVSVIDVKKRAVLSTLSISGRSPSGIALSPDGARAYVANLESGNISVLDLGKKTEIATIAVGDDPFYVALSRDGRKAYVTNAGSDKVMVVDTLAQVVAKKVPVNQSSMGVVVTEDGHQVYVANTGTNTVTVIATNTDTVVKTLVVGSKAVSGPQQFATDPNSAEVYVSLYFEPFVARIDSSTNVPHPPVPVGKDPMGIAVTPDGRILCVTNQDSNTASFIDIETKTILATVPVGEKPTFVLISK